MCISPVAGNGQDQSLCPSNCCTGLDRKSWRCSCNQQVARTPLSSDLRYSRLPPSLKWGRCPLNFIDRACRLSLIFGAGCIFSIFAFAL